MQHPKSKNRLCLLLKRGSLVQWIKISLKCPNVSLSLERDYNVRSTQNNHWITLLDSPSNPSQTQFNHFLKLLIFLNIGLSSQNFAQKWDILFWNQRARTEAADQAPKSEPSLRDRHRFLAQPLWRLRRVLFYRNRSILKCIKHKQSRTMDQTIVQLRRLQISERDIFALGSHWGHHLRSDNLFRDYRRSTCSSFGSSFWILPFFATRHFWNLEWPVFAASGRGPARFGANLPIRHQQFKLLLFYYYTIFFCKIIEMTAKQSQHYFHYSTITMPLFAFIFLLFFLLFFLLCFLFFSWQLFYY